MKFEFLPLKDSGLDQPAVKSLVGFEHVRLSYVYQNSEDKILPEFGDDGDINETLRVYPKIDGNDVCFSVQACFKNTVSQIDNVITCCTGVDVIVCIDVIGTCYGIGSNKYNKLINSDIEFYYDWIRIPTPFNAKIVSVGSGIDYIMFMDSNYEIYLRGDISKGQAGLDTFKDNDGNYYTSYPFVVDNTVNIIVGRYGLVFLKPCNELLYDGYIIGSASVYEIKNTIIACAKRVSELETCQVVTCEIVSMNDDPNIDPIVKLAGMLAAETYDGNEYVKTDFVRLLSLAGA